MWRWGAVALLAWGCDDGGADPWDYEIWDLPRMIADAAPPDAAAEDASPADATPADQGAPDAAPALDAAPVADQFVVDAAVDMAPPMPVGSAGCGQAEPYRRGGQWIDAMEFSAEAGGTRGFYLSVPQWYRGAEPHALIIGYPGTDWLGGQIRDYLRLEDGRLLNEIFVYPDPLWRDFGDWGVRGGWQLGPDGWNAEGMEDLTFTAELIDHLMETYCIDPDRVFVTGHSWGGDMAHVVSCFLGERVRAAAPAAANQPFWFSTVEECPGSPAVWTFFGIADDHFNLPEPTYGDACRDFWLEENDCTGVDARAPIDLGPEEACSIYAGCAADTRYCLYGPATRHQIPPYFSRTVMEWFRGFE